MSPKCQMVASVLNRAVKWVSGTLLGSGVVFVAALSLWSSVGQSNPIPGKPAHHVEGGFSNPYLPPDHKPGVGRYLWMRLTDDIPYSDWEGKGYLVPQVSLSVDSLKSPDPDVIQVSWLGHSTFLIQSMGLNIITDPVFSERCSPVSWAGPKRILPPAVDIASLPPIDYVIISHSHYDHLDVDSIEQLPGIPHFFVPLGLKQWFSEAGVSDQRVSEFDWWDGEVKEEGKLWVQATPGQHFSGRSPFDFNETLWASWMLTLGDVKVWFAGDTGYNPYQFKAIGEQLGPVDLALIPIGAYSPRWFMKPQHVNPEEAVKIAQDVKAKKSIGMHWGTFQLSAEDVLDPVEALTKAKRELGMEDDAFTTMALGEQIHIPLRANQTPQAVSTSP